MTIKTKRTLVFWGISLFIAFCYMYFFAIPYSDNQWANNYKKFNEANIYGRVEKIGIKNHGTSFKIKNDFSEYVFYPYNIKLNDSKPFNEFVKEGDSVMKPAFSEILVVFKNGKAYEYRFQKNNNMVLVNYETTPQHRRTQR